MIAKIGELTVPVFSTATTDGSLILISDSDTKLLDISTAIKEHGTVELYRSESDLAGIYKCEDLIRATTWSDGRVEMEFAIYSTEKADMLEQCVLEMSELLYA